MYDYDDHHWPDFDHLQKFPSDRYNHTDLDDDDFPRRRLFRDTPTRNGKTAIIILLFILACMMAFIRCGTPTDADYARDAKMRAASKEQARKAAHEHDHTSEAMDKWKGPR